MVYRETRRHCPFRNGHTVAATRGWTAICGLYRGVSRIVIIIIVPLFLSGDPNGGQGLQQ